MLHSITSLKTPTVYPSVFCSKIYFETHSALSQATGYTTELWYNSQLWQQTSILSEVSRLPLESTQPPTQLVPINIRVSFPSGKDTEV